jgi:hypothetical protein
MRLFGSRASVTADTPLDGAIAPDSKRKMSAAPPASTTRAGARTATASCNAPPNSGATHSWGDRLPAGDVAVVLLPYPAGRVGPALAGARIVYTPVAVCGRAETRPAVELLAMQVVRLWLHMTPDTGTLILAPPVLEEFQRARLQRRSLLDCGVSAS